MAQSVFLGTSLGPVCPGWTDEDEDADLLTVFLLRDVLQVSGLNPSFGKRTGPTRFPSWLQAFGLRAANIKNN